MSAVATESIIHKLQEIQTLEHIPEDQLMWLIDNSEISILEAGQTLFSPGHPSEQLHILLEGRVRVWLGAGSNTRELSRMEKGTITGILPFSRLKSSVANSEALEYSIVLSLHRDRFQEMIRDHYELTAAFVHAMNDRIRNFTTLQQQNEKLLSLGKLSAGLSHELNNPAAALVRSSKELKKHLSYNPQKFKKVMTMKIDLDAVDEINEILNRKMAKGPNEELSLMEKTDLEDEIRDWLEDRNIEDDDDFVENLVEFDFSIEDLDQIENALTDTFLPGVLKWIDSNLTTEKLVVEIQDASRRISDLVGSVKSYTHMDQTLDRQSVNIHDGIKNTLVILKHKLKKNNIELVKDFDPDLPHINAFPGELNQVWTNIIDNAIDAMEDGGRLEISTQMDGPCVLVKIIDSGKGIPEDVLPRIFDPFYTTKPMGKGTGLGLDVVQKIIQHHQADIDVDSRPGRTEFRLLFPVE